MSSTAIHITHQTHKRLKGFSKKTGMKMTVMSDRAVNDYLDRLIGNDNDQASELRKMMEGQ